MNPRLVVCLFGAISLGLLAAALALAAGWGVVASLSVYSGTGSTVLVGLAVFLPERRPALARVPRVAERPLPA